MAKLTLNMSDETLLELTEAARLAGVTPERMAEKRLEAWAQTADGSPGPDHAADYDLNEIGRPWSEVRPELEALLERKLQQTQMTHHRPPA